MVIGYARVSTQQQNLDRQIEALNKYGAERIYSDKSTGANMRREQFERMIEHLRPGDTVVVESLSRLGRRSSELIALIDEFTKTDITLVSLKESIDISTPIGRMLVKLIAAIAEMEREVTVERVKEGIACARARGRNGGRPKKDESSVKIALTLYDSNAYSMRDIEERTGVSKSTLYRAIRERKGKG